MNWLVKEEPEHYPYDQLERDRKTIDNPKNWPLYPLLPMKRWNEANRESDQACLWFTPKQLYIGVGINLYTIEDIRKTENIWKPVTVDEVLSAGWQVD